MSNLSTILGGGSEAVDPRKEGLPLFGLWGQQSNGNNHVNYRIFDSAFRNVGSPWGAVSNSTTSYRFGILGDAMHAYNMSDMGSGLGGNLGSSGYTAYEAFNHSGYQVDQYPHAMYYSASRNGHVSWQSYHNIGQSIEFKLGWTKINMVLPEGCRPRRMFCNRGMSLKELSGNNQLAHVDYYDYSSDLVSTSYPYAVATGYNEKTKTLVMLHSSNESSSNDKCVHILKSSKDLNSVTRIKDFFDNLTSAELFTGSWSQQHNRDHVIVVGNNDHVGISRKQSHYISYGVFDCSVGGGTTTAARQSQSWQQFTGAQDTSYGAAQGSHYRTKFNTTWDNTWGLIYNPYHYYGSGISGFAVNLENPRKFIGICASQPSYTNPWVAHGRTGFHGGCSENTDGSAWYTYSWQLDPTDSDHTTTTRVYFGAMDGDDVVSTGNGYEGGNFTNGTGVASPNQSNTGLHGGYYSTCYPILMNLNWWGAYSSADASYGGK